MQILNFLVVNIILNSKNEITATDPNYQDMTYDSADLQSCKKDVPYNLPERIIVF